MAHIQFRAFPFRKVGFTLLLLSTLLPVISPTFALFTGFTFALIWGNPFPVPSRKISKLALQVAVVGLGFGMNLQQSIQTGKEGIGYTLLTVIAVMTIGVTLGRWLKLSRATAWLVAAGTAICGGSAIAAVSPVIRSNEVETSVSLSTVFILNAIGLLVFPDIGHLFHLSQHQFGLWSAIAIHDTSSVVGAGAAYGQEALRIATTVKLTRALWIIPVTVASMFVFRSSAKQISIPWFILLYFVAIAINSYLNIIPEITERILSISRKLLTMTLFLIGSGMTRSALKTTGFRPLIMGSSLWIMISVTSLCVIIWMR